MQAHKWQNVSDVRFLILSVQCGSDGPEICLQALNDILSSYIPASALFSMLNPIFSNN
jgi:hypothetical protein